MLNCSNPHKFKKVHVYLFELDNNKNRIKIYDNLLYFYIGNFAYHKTKQQQKKYIMKIAEQYVDYITPS